MFKSTLNHGFQLVFSNGNTISVQFGAFNYCSRKDCLSFDIQADLKTKYVTSQTAEVAIFNSKTGYWYQFGNGDTVEGYVSADEIPALIDFAANTLLDESNARNIGNSFNVPFQSRCRDSII